MSPAVVFDVGNVLIRWDARLVLQGVLPAPEIDALMAEIGFDAWNLEQDRGRSWDEAVAVATAAHPHHAEAIRRFHHDWQKAVPGAIDGTVEILETLRGDGRALYAITNFSAEKWEECRGRFPFLASHFRDVVVSAHVGRVKPDPAIFELFLARNGLNAADCIFIDDSARNVAGARALGFDAILFEGPAALRSALAERGVTP